MARRSGQVVARGERKWLVRWHVGQGPASGKYLYKSKTVHGTKRDAQKFLTQVLRSQDVGTYVEPTRMTLNAYLDRWLESARPTLTPRSFDDYDSLLTRYVRTPLGAQRLDSLRPLDLQELYADMLRRGLAARTVRMAHAPLRRALGQALRWGLLAQNPATLVELPKERKTEKLALDQEQVVSFRKAAKGTRFEVLWDLLFATGCRPGEALALHWSDFDSEAGTVTIRRALSRVRGGVYEIQAPKTEGSWRTVPLPPTLVAALRRHRAAQAERRLQPLIFGSDQGTPLNPRNLSQRYLKPIVKEAKLPAGVTLYTFRHTCATLALAAGLTANVVAERLGHASTQMVLDTYGHVLTGMQEEATAKLGALLFGDSSNSSHTIRTLKADPGSRPFA